jgi:hypothetical protein
MREAGNRDRIWLWSFLAFFLLFSSISTNLRDDRGKGTIFMYDVDNYYSYLPAAFIHNDLSFSYPNGYWLTLGPKGYGIAKGTMGMSIMYSPFFGIAYLHASLGGYELDGYSEPFITWVHLGSLFYGLVAAFFILKSLFLFFKPLPSVLAYIAVLFGSNYFYYLFGQSAMAHSYIFALFGAIVWFTLRWHKTEAKKYLFLVAFLCGFVTLIRPTDAVIVLFPFLYGIYSKESFSAKLQLLGKNLIPLLICVPIFFLPLLPQMIYWKIYAGSFLFFSYGSEESFFFNDPQIMNVLFSWRKGLMIYTPLAMFMVLGLIPLWKKFGKLALPITSIFLLTLYVVSCWWDWWFGGSFGHRAFVQYFALLIFPLTALISWGISRWQKALVSVPILTLVVYLNIYQTFQFKYVIIHWDSMTKEAYFQVWQKMRLTPEEVQKVQGALKTPDYIAARKGERD